jgi:hypothetical protein
LIASLVSVSCGLCLVIVGAVFLFSILSFQP